MLTPSHHNIYQTIAELAQNGRDWALALVLASRGSTPGKAGAKAVFRADGSMLGTIGGGAVEAEAGRIAPEVIETGCPVAFEFALGGEVVADVEPICGGAMQVLVVPGAALPVEVYEAAAGGLKERVRGVLVTRVSIADPLSVSSDDSGRRPNNSPSCRILPPPTGRIVSIQYAAEDKLANIVGVEIEMLRGTLAGEEPRLVEAGPGEEILIEPLVPNPLLLIVGAGHVGKAVAWQARPVGFELIVIDDRKEFLGADRFPPGTSVRYGPMPQLVGSLPLTADTYVVIVTRGHQHDAEVLAACLNRSAAYVGMIGSRRKVAELRKDFLQSGRATQEAFDRVYAPIGLDIGARTVPEIAASIVAQLVAVHRCGTAPRIGTS